MSEVTARSQETRENRDGRFGSKVGQIGPKWDKSWAFFRSDFSAFGAGAPNALKSDLKKAQDYSHLRPI